MSNSEELTLTEFLRDPKRAYEAVDRSRRLVIRRRNAPDLLLSRADSHEEEIEGAGAYARMLRNLVTHLTRQDLGDIVEESFPWTAYLSPEGRAQFATELATTFETCSELDTLAPLGQLLYEWKATAAAQADPELATRLSAPIPEPDGRLVPPTLTFEYSSAVASESPLRLPGTIEGFN